MRRKVTARILDFKLLQSEKVPAVTVTENTNNKLCVTLDRKQVEIIESALRHSIFDIVIENIYNYENSLLTLSEIKERVSVSDEVVAINQILELLGKDKEKLVDNEQRED